jgi:hypothetical protein
MRSIPGNSKLINPGAHAVDRGLSGMVQAIGGTRT